MRFISPRAAAPEQIISVTVPDHAASRRVMKKCGLVFQAQIGWRRTQVVWYALDRQDYRG
jgi:RimJ/RimL family protein N-acetyltransferase